MKTYAIRSISKTEDFPFNVEKTLLETDFSIHNHDFSELVVISGGKGVHIIDEAEYRIKAGDVFVIKGDTSHGFRDVDGLELYNIMYDIRQTPVLNSELRKIAGFQSLFILEPYYRKEHRFKSRLHLGPEMLKKITGLLDTMIDEYINTGEGYKSILQAYFTTLVVLLSREYTGSTDPVSVRLFYLADAIAYMESSFIQPLKLDELAARALMSTRHFSRVFKENYHTTPVEYLIHLRLNHALSLMGNENLNVTQISQECGFSDSNYFSRLFRKKFGMPPGEYRKNIQSGF